MVKILIISTHLNKKEAAFRRLSYFRNFLRRHQYDAMCLGFKALTYNGIVNPSGTCINSHILYLSTRFISLNHFINTLLSFYIIPYVLVLKPGIILLSVPDSFPLIPAYIASKIIKAKFIVDVRDPTEEICLNSPSFCKKIDRFLFGHIMRKINYTLYKRADAVITVTLTAKMILEKVLEKKVFMVPNGADLEYFKPEDKTEVRRRLNFASNEFLVIYAGTIGGYYNVTDAIEVFKELDNTTNNRTIRLVLAGTIVDRKHSDILRKIQTPNIIYLGALDAKRLKELYSAGDVGLIPRINDPAFDYAVPTKFYEYVAMGLPVLAICRKESELAKIIIENRLGIVCESKECLKESIKILASNIEVYNAFKENVLRYRKHVDRKIGAKILFTILKQFIER